MWENAIYTTTATATIDAAGGTGGARAGAAQAKQTKTTEKWILYLNANGVAYQDILPFTIKYAASLKANLLTINYRGVNDSTGCTTGSRSLTADAERALQ